MNLLFDSLRAYTSNKIGRREFLKRAAAAGLTTPAVIAFLQGCTPASVSQNSGSDTPKVDLSKFSKDQATANPLVFNAWNYLPEVVAGFQREFESQFSESVNYEVIPGDYTTIMLNKLVANSPLDCLYTKAQGTKMLAADWLHDLSDLENIDEIKKATLPAQWAAQSYQGKIFGLPYFNSMKCCLAYNRIRLKEAGLSESDLPKTWDEAYDIGRRLKKDGFLEHAIVMRWAPNSDALLDNFIAECLSRGDKLWDEQFNAVFDENTAVGKTLDAWQKIWKDGLVPPDSLGAGDQKQLFGTGDPLFTCTQSYELKDLNDPSSGALAGNVMMVPYNGQPWGFLDYGLYSIAKRPKEDAQRLERRKRWVSFMGYKDKNGSYRVAKEWVKQANLGTGYAEIYSDPEVIDAYKSWMPEYPKLRDIMSENEKHVQICNGWHAVWYPEWAVKAVDVIPKVITGDMGVSEGIRAMRDEWDLQQKRYS